MQNDVAHRGEGNTAVVKLLEDWLKIAKEGNIDCAALVLTDNPTGYRMGQAGIIGYEFAVMAGLEKMRDKIKKSIDNRQPPLAPENTTADRVMYNLVRMSCSFDFLSWMVNAEMARVREGAPAPLKVGFFHGYDTSMEDAIGGGQRGQNFEHVMGPIMGLLGAVEDPESVANGRQIDTLSLGPVVDAFNKGEPLPKLTINDESRDEIRKHLIEACGQLPVTITLREADHFPNRNSNLTEWLKFAEWLEGRGEKVLFIRDTAKATEPITGYPCCPPASQNLFVRAAVYQVAKANLFVSNGPAMLAVLFSDMPWLMFSPLTIDNRYIPGTPDGWKHFTGIGSGDQFPWANPDQRVIYKPGTFETIRDAWLEHIEPLLKAAA